MRNLKAVLRQGTSFAGQLWRADTGGAMTMFAFILPALLGASAMGIDLAMWFDQRREVQSQADAGAIAATYVQLEDGDLEDAEDAATTEASRNGFDSAKDTIEVTDASGLDVDTGLSPGYRVTITQPARLFFMSMFMNSANIKASAVGGTRDVAEGGAGCIWALNPTASQAMYFTGNTTVNVGCNLYSNSNSASSIEVWGSANVSTPLASAHGDIKIGGSGSLSSTNPLQTYSSARDNPFADAPLTEPPSSLPCLTDGNKSTYINYSGDFEYKSASGGKWQVGSSKTGSLSPKTTGGAVRICNNFDVQGTITLGAGVYFIDSSNFDIGAQANFTATAGVTIVLIDSATSTATGVGTVNINGNPTVNHNAPTAATLAGSDYDDYQGMAWVIKADSTSGEIHKFNGGANFHVNGLIYSPDDKIEYSGNSGNTNSCTLVFADTIKFTGNSGIYNDTTSCAGVGVDAMLTDYPMVAEAHIVVLVE